ncbi:MAG: NAD(P)/FAD-dependent oxidoreductase [Spirochaetota bacterium]
MSLESKKYDVVVVGAGMGGLSSGAFLAKEGKSVLLLEKHDKPGGYLTSFTRGEYTFDSAIFHLTDMGEGQTISQFIRYWGEEIQATKVDYRFRYFIGLKEYIINSRNAQQDLIRYFPEETNAVEKFFSLASRMIEETLSQAAPKPPYAMNWVEKIVFGFTAVFNRPLFLRYATRSSVKFLKRHFKNKSLASLLWSYYPLHSLILFAHVFGWETATRGEIYYPQGGMQAIPNAAVKAVKRNGGELVLNCEVERILIQEGRAAGVRCTDGREFYADVVISNAPIHHTLFKLTKGIASLDGLRAEIDKRKICGSGVFVFLGVDQSYDFDGVNFLAVMEEETIDTPEEKLTPQNCPILLIVPPQPQGQTNYSVILAAILPYEYEHCWRTEGTREQGEPYYQLKTQVKNSLLDRVCQKLGEEFRGVIRYSLASTPLTFERYTYNEKGSFMGWKVDRAHYGKFLPQTTPIKNFYLAGQWVFPGFGVPGVMASGYYAAKTILAREGINLETRMKDHFERRKNIQ